MIENNNNTDTDTNRFFGIYRGLVTDNKDPENKGRIKVIIPKLFGNEETGWCEPCIPLTLSYKKREESGSGRSFDMTPDIGSGVWIEFEEGDISLPVWVGTWWK